MDGKANRQKGQMNPSMTSPSELGPFSALLITALETSPTLKVLYLQETM